MASSYGKSLRKTVTSSPKPERGGVLLLAGLLVLLAGCRQAEQAAPPPPVVVVMDIIPQSVPLDTEMIGHLDSPENVEIRARVEAFVDGVHFTEGTPVEEGDLLFTLDSRPYQERLAAAEGMLAEAEAATNKYQKDVERLQPLVEKRAVPRQDLDNALASVDVGKASVLSAQARVEAAMIDLSYCELRAPISGLIGAREVSIGALVGKGEPTLLATLSTLDPIWFYGNISEVDYLRAVHEIQGQDISFRDLPVTLILSNGYEHPSPGALVFLDRAVDIQTGTIRIRAAFPNPDKRLRPGMFARIRIDLGQRPDSIVIPRRAVQELQGKNFVWVITPDNKAQQRMVEVQQSVGQNLLLRSGLQAGERIVVEGLQKVRENMPVQPQPMATDPGAAPGGIDS